MTCEEPCRLTCDDPGSSAGCDFVLSRPLHNYEEWADELVIANPTADRGATLSVEMVGADGVTRDVLPRRSLEAGDLLSVPVDTPFLPGVGSAKVSGQFYRVRSDSPVAAYLIAPARLNRGNEASMLLPTAVLGTKYVVASYPGNDTSVHDGLPSFFEVVATEDTQVTWRPPLPTRGSGDIPSVLPGEQGAVLMRAGETMRIAAEDFDPTNPFAGDLSGTVIEATAPIWVVSGTRCATVPVYPGVTGSTCDPLQEVLIPVNAWGTRYVAPVSPIRGSEWHHYRVYGGRAGVTVRSEPALAEFPTTLGEGEFVDVSVPPNTGFVLDGDGPFMPVAYGQSRYLDASGNVPVTDYGNASFGDANMVQLVPTSQFLCRYGIATATGFAQHFLTVIREQGGAPVYVDDDYVEGFSAIEGTGFEVLHMRIAEGTHRVLSDEAFGIVQSGFSSPRAGDPMCTNLPEGGTCNASYAYPGGLRL